MPSTNKSIHREEYLYLAGLSESSVLIAWGAFFFEVQGESERRKWKLIDDDDLTKLSPVRTKIIGERSEPYAENNIPVVVTLAEKTTREVSTLLVAGANHALFTQLKPDTTYTYTVTINGKEWELCQSNR